MNLAKDQYAISNDSGPTYDGRTREKLRVSESRDPVATSRKEVRRQFRFETRAESAFQCLRSAPVTHKWAANADIARATRRRIMSITACKSAWP